MIAFDRGLKILVVDKVGSGAFLGGYCNSYIEFRNK